LAEPNRTPQAFSAVNRFAVYNKRLGSLQSRLERRKERFELFVGQVDGAGDVTDFILEARPNVNEERRTAPPQRLGLSGA
jgi:hypothetical protein